jgi:PleD family two-component response regulator
MSFTVLIAGADRCYVERLSGELLDEGFLVRQAFDGKMALEAIDRVPTDLVITNAVLPDLDAAALARRLQQRREPIPVVLTDAGAQPGEIPGVSFVADATDLPELVAAVHRALADRRRTSQPLLVPQCAVAGEVAY